MLGIALLILVALFVGRPLLVAQADMQAEAPSEATAEARGPSAALQQQKDALLAQIRELDFDYETGKIPEAPYRRRRQQLAAEAARLLRQIDQLAPAVANGASADEAIEAAISARRSDGAARAVPGVEIDQTIEKAIARRRQGATGNRARSLGAARFCASCGEPREPEDRFCAYCGEALH